jgi:hypothetical protein
MATFIPNLAAPHKVVYIPFGMTSTPAGTAPVTSAVYRMWTTDAQTDILSIQLVRQTGTVDSGLTYVPGTIPATTATGALTALAAAGTADTATVGLINVLLDVPASGGSDVTVGPTVPPGTVVGFTATGTASNARLQGMIIKYRSI